MDSDKQFFFIDDSGSRKWETPYSKAFVDNPPERNEENINFWRRNYFILAGLHINQEKVSEINQIINQAKIDLFGTKHVEIKSDCLRNPHQRRKTYIEPFGISEEQLKQFIDIVWYPLFKRENFTLQAFVLDKRYFAGKRSESTPIALLTQILFDRLEMVPADDCVVVFDQMEADVKTKKRDHGVILSVSNQEINASPFNAKYSHSEVRFEQSSKSNFLQLADTAAYNVYRQFVTYGDQWEDPECKEMETYDYFELMSECFICDIRGVIAGYGLVKYPNPIKKRWKIDI